MVRPQFGSLQPFPDGDHYLLILHAVVQLDGLALVLGEVLVTLAQLHAQLHVPKPTIHRHLGRLVAANTVERAVVSGLVVFSMKDSELASSGNQLTPRQEQAVAIARDKGRITRQELAEALGISIRTASRDLAGRSSLMPDGRIGRLAGYEYPDIN